MFRNDVRNLFCFLQQKGKEGATRQYVCVANIRATKVLSYQLITFQESSEIVDCLRKSPKISIVTKRKIDENFRKVPRFLLFHIKLFNLVIGVKIKHTHVEATSNCLGIFPNKESRHCIVTMRIPSRQKKHSIYHNQLCNNSFALLQNLCKNEQCHQFSTLQNRAKCQNISVSNSQPKETSPISSFLLH